MKWGCAGLLAGIWALIAVGSAAAHTGAPLAPHDAWTAWKWDPAILLGLALMGWLYGRGVWALWRRAGTGRGVTTGQAIVFYAGLVVLFVALISPVDALGGVLFSAHMVQHLLLMLVAAPLLVLGAPTWALLWGVPRGSRGPLARWWQRQHGLQALWHVVTAPVTVWLLYAGSLWVWHAPDLYQAALRSEAVHALEHASFLGPALLFWWVLVRKHMHGTSRYGTGMIMAFTTAFHSSLLGALLTFSAAPWYPSYAAGVDLWGLTPLEDQQLAGVLMWVPAGLLYLVVTLALLGRWLAALERHDGSPDPMAPVEPRPAHPERVHHRTA